MIINDGEQLPVGPCNEDGESSAGNDEVGIAEVEPRVRAPEAPEPVDSIRLRPPRAQGWYAAQGLDGMYRHATDHESDRYGWPNGTLLLATPFDLIGPAHDDKIWLSMPVRSGEDEEHWLLDDDLHVVFHRHDFSKVQTLALGSFVEHRHRGLDEEVLVTRPTFDYFGGVVSGRSVRALVSSDGVFLLRESGPEGMEISGPHHRKLLDIAAPVGYSVSIVSPSPGRITRPPLAPYDCENGECQNPGDATNECIDGVDNDADGHHDLCDWNCLPHADFGADKYPLAASRVESGKSYAIMGHGSICTNYGETWTVQFAEAALDASEFLNSIRPDLGRPVRYRVFSCWVFEDWDAYRLCQFGPYEIVDGEPVFDPPVCPFDYPYAPTEEDQLNVVDQANLLFEEASRRSWVDLEQNTEILGADGEPVNGVIMMTSNKQTLCPKLLFPNNCPTAAGLAHAVPYSPITEVGGAVVSNLNTDLWHTLARETGHTLGLLHDDAVGGFMNGELPLGYSNNLGTTVDPEHPGLDNNQRWEDSLMSKGELPRSSGFYHSGCTGPLECAPLGKPGWSCNGLWCEEQD